MKIPKQKKTAGKKADRFTFIILPASAAPPVRINISKRSIAVCLTVLAVIAFGALTTTVKYHSRQADFKRVEQIKQESLDKDKTIQKLAEEIETIDKRQQELQTKQAEIKKMMGIKTENRVTEQPSRGGQGGADLRTRPFSVKDSLDTTYKVRASLGQNDKEIEQLLARVKKDTAYYRSIPNQWPAEGEISSPFGWRESPFGGQKEGYHDGVDVANNYGTPILAAGDGTVTWAGWKKVYGQTIEISHGNGLLTRYGHNSRLLVAAGDKVQKGQTIAVMGSTGRSTGPHLHFSVLKQGVPQNPYDYLP
ncbi:MAG: peptidoglycan DD-metalloendopeptidase family protein [Syntrophomonadaceae bacterium]|jgi:murein DD-endopeptidase MepM/ murein hydrolase activator NlpD